MKQALLVIFLLGQLLAAKSGAAQQTMPTPLPKKAARVLREDVELLQKILEQNHPSLYWYTPKDSIDAYFGQTVASITDSLNEVQFKNKVAWLVNQIRCGHTSVRFSKAYGRMAPKYRYPQFPLALKAWGDSLVVLGTAYANDTLFKRGTIVTAINGVPNKKILDTLFQYMSTDGYGDNFKNQVVSGNFPAWYKTILGSDSVYAITYLDTTGSERTATVKAFRPVIDTAAKGKTLPQEHRTRREIRQMNLLAKRSLVIDTARQTAYMRLTTFSGGGLRGFFRRSFKTIQRMQLSNLVIDVRENGGGNVNHSIRLTRYLSKQPFKVGDSIVAQSRKFRHAAFFKPVLPYWISMNLFARKMSDGQIHFRRYETRRYQPYTKNHFNGKVYVVQGGLTFSAATMFIGSIKGQSNVTVVGEETGGGYYGNSAMHIPLITLPNSGLRISLPLYRLVIDATRPKGRGIPPDILIPPSSEAIRKGIDLKMERIKGLIGKEGS